LFSAAPGRKVLADGRKERDGSCRLWNLSLPKTDEGMELHCQRMCHLRPASLRDAWTAWNAAAIVGNSET